MSRLTVGLDSSSARLIDAVDAMKLAGDRILPKESARDIAALARATRRALMAQELPLAEGMLTEIEGLLPGAPETAVEVITRQVANVRRYIGGGAR